MSVCLYPINVKTAQPNGPYFLWQLTWHETLNGNNFPGKKFLLLWFFKFTKFYRKSAKKIYWSIIKMKIWKAINYKAKNLTKNLTKKLSTVLYLGNSVYTYIYIILFLVAFQVSWCCKANYLFRFERFHFNLNQRG